MQTNNERWIEFEHTRLQSVSAWPETAYKRATMNAILYTLKGICPYHREADPAKACPYCHTPRKSFAVAQRSSAA
jgi:hypothetical protein